MAKSSRLPITAFSIYMLVSTSLGSACVVLPQPLSFQQATFNASLEIGITTPSQGNTIHLTGNFSDPTDHSKETALVITKNKDGLMCISTSGKPSICEKSANSSLRVEFEMKDSSGKTVGLLSMAKGKLFLFSVDEHGSKAITKPYLAIDFKDTDHMDISAYDKSQQVGSLSAVREQVDPKLGQTRGLSFDQPQKSLQALELSGHSTNATLSCVANGIQTQPFVKTDSAGKLPLPK